MILSFRPQIYDESETDQILNAKYFVWKNYILGKWGTRKAFNQNSLMQLFNGDRRIVHWSRWPVISDLHHRCYIHLKIIWFITSLASVKILHMWYTERAIMASSCFFVCDLPLGHAVHAPHGSAVAIDAAFGWRINPWWGRSTWRGASSFQFHIAGLRVFWSHSRSSLL